MEPAQGLVGVTERGVLLMLQLVKVSLHAMDAHIGLYSFLSPVVCPVFTLRNGDILYNDENRRVDTNATYSCYVGYFLEGEPVITCQLSDNNIATWSESLSMCKGVLENQCLLYYPEDIVDNGRGTPLTLCISIKPF